MTDNPDSERRIGSQMWSIQGYLIRPAQRFTPPTDILETADEIIVFVEIAGMRSDNFKIALYNQNLIISGVRERPDVEAVAYHQVEIGFGEFRVSIPMPWSIDEPNIEANYRNGFLRIKLPRKQAQHIHIVDVNTSEE